LYTTNAPRGLAVRLTAMSVPEGARKSPLAGFLSICSSVTNQRLVGQSK